MGEDVFNPFISADISPPFSAQWQAKRRLAQALRELTEVLLTATPPIADMNALAEQLEAQTRHCAEAPRLYGQMAFLADGNHGLRGEVNYELNAVAGLSNPLAPGLRMWFEGERALARVSCGWAYEGPPGHIHGGHVAAIFDQFMGIAQILGQQPGMTSKLKVHYLRPAPLQTELKLSAWLVQVTGRETTMQAEMHNGDTLIANCEALFIRPKDGPVRELFRAAGGRSDKPAAPPAD